MHFPVPIRTKVFTSCTNGPPAKSNPTYFALLYLWQITFPVYAWNGSDNFSTKFRTPNFKQFTICLADSERFYLGSTDKFMESRKIDKFSNFVIALQISTVFIICCDLCLLSFRKNVVLKTNPFLLFLLTFDGLKNLN